MMGSWQTAQGRPSHKRLIDDNTSDTESPIVDTNALLEDDDDDDILTVWNEAIIKL